MSIVRFRDIAPENVYNALSVPLGIDENVNLVPLVFFIAGVDDGVFESAAKAVFGGILECGFAAYQLVEARRVGWVQNSVVKRAQLG